MYPKVFLDCLDNRLDHVQVSVLPTLLFFYGMELGDEVSSDIERGKTLICGEREPGRRRAHGVLRADRPATLGKDS
jgi:pyruvate carboxylase